MAIKISNVMIMMVMGMGVFMGMMTFMGELGQTYDIYEADNSSDDIQEIYENIENATTELQGTLTGDDSWLETSWNIVFALPQTAMSTLSTMANSAGKLMTVAMGDESSEVTIPGWIITMMYSLIAIIIVTTLIYLVIGRGM